MCAHKWKWKHAQYNFMFFASKHVSTSCISVPALVICSNTDFTSQHSNIRVKTFYNVWSKWEWWTRYIPGKNDTNTSKPVNSKNLFKIFHQNIWGLKSKLDELSNSLRPDYPHILCLTEHSLKSFEIDNLPIDPYKLGSKFCRHEFKNWGGVFLSRKILISPLSHLITTARKRILKFVL